MIPQTQRYYNNDFGVYVFMTTDDIPKYSDYVATVFDEDGSTKKKQSIIAGNMQQLTIGQEYEVEAALVFNKKYNSYQYKPRVIISKRPSTQKEQAKFLHAILTESQAENLIAAYPNIVNEIIDGTDNVDLSIVGGIGKITYGKIKERILENYVISDILSLLQPLGVSYKMIQKLLSGEPNPSLLKAKLIDNPYIMTRIRGLGFKRVDGLAINLNPKMIDSPKRAYAFIKWFLNETAENDGHTWVTLDVLNDASKDKIPECMAVYHELIETERENEMFLHFNGVRVGLKRYYELECNTYEILKEINSYHDNWELDADGSISEAENELGFSFTEEQRKTVKSALTGNVTFICGFAGTGKSTLLNAITKAYKYKSVSCCALSAKAAQRIIEATGHDASTIHRLLGWNGHEFSHNSEMPLSSDVVILDEASMVNIELFHDLISAIKPGGRLVVCGDNRQLPPIGAGNVFSDLLDKKNTFHVFMLTKVMRQAMDSGILMDANKIRQGISPIKEPELKIVTGKREDMFYMFRENNEAIQNMAIKTYLSTAEKEGTENVVIVVPRKKDCPNSTQVMNRIIQDKLLPEDKNTKHIDFGEKVFRIGSKVIQRENNYEKNVFNGETGYVTDIFEAGEDDEKTLYFTVEYTSGDDVKSISYKRSEMKQVELAYALTVHLAQGSGYKTVIVAIDTTHYILLDSCLLYTAITRAKERCLLLAQPKAFLRCIHNNNSIARQTWMKLIEE